MKRLVFLLIGLIAFMRIGQPQAIPNGGFERWEDLSFEYPTGYSNNANFFNNYYYMYGYHNHVALTLEKVTSAYHGNYAVKLSTKIIGNDTLIGHFINNNPYSGEGGFPIAGKPTGIKGYYKGNFVNNDSAVIYLAFYKTGNLLGEYEFHIGTTNSNFTPFSFILNPPLTVFPDTFIIGFASSNPYNNIPQNGTWIILDSISFLGIPSQPTQMNGSFENWTFMQMVKPEKWYLQSDYSLVNRTNDAYENNFALQLKTLPDNSGNYAIFGSVSTMRWVWDGNQSIPVGGDHYNLTKDTLVLAYKYLAQNDDSAQIALTFKNTNNQITEGINIYLPEELSYTVVEYPFELLITPDTISITISSSKSYDSANVGSILYIDKIFLKSEPNVSLPESIRNKNLLLYPNPAINELNITAEDYMISIALYAQDGKLISIHPVNDKRFVLPVTSLPAGNFFLEIQFNDTKWIKPWSKL